MRSYIKLYGPPILEAIKSLEEVAFDIPDVCIMNTLIEAAMSSLDYYPMKYFRQFGSITLERCNKIISKSGIKVGIYDFYFEWSKNPTRDDLDNLVEKIEAALIPLGCRYTMTNIG